MSIHEFLADAVAILAASTLVVLASHKLRVPSVVGFLLSGVLIGPSGLRLVADPRQVEVFAEIGVVFLLFTIGLEFSLERLREIRRAFFLGGSMQSLLTIAAVGALAWLAGLASSRALFLGFLVALSSTAIVLKLYADRRELEAPHGKLVIGILLFQDFLIVPMIVLTPVLVGRPSRPRSAPWRCASWSRSRRWRRCSSWRATSCRGCSIPSCAPGSARCWCSAPSSSAWAWRGSPKASASRWRSAPSWPASSSPNRSTATRSSPRCCRSATSSTASSSSRSACCSTSSWRSAPAAAVAGLALAIILVKAVAACGAAALLGLPARIVVIAGLSLAQIGEFSFVLLQVGQDHGMLAPALYQAFIAASVLTMMATPLLVAWAPALAERLPALPSSAAPAAVALSDHVLVVGFGVSGRNLARVLREAAIRYLVLELNPELVRAARAAGEPVQFGDATRREILEHAGIERARVVVFAISDLAAVRRSVRFARELNPGVHILVRTRAVADIEELRSLGADEVLAEEFETSIEIFTRVLRRLHVPGNVIRAQTRLLRGEDYRMLRTPAGDERLTDDLLRILAAGVTDVYLLSERHLREETTIRSLALRKRAGATIIAVVRGQESHTNPPADLRLEPGDALVLVGSHAEIERAFDQLDGLAEAP